MILNISYTLTHIFVLPAMYFAIDSQAPCKQHLQNTRLAAYLRGCYPKRVFKWSLRVQRCSTLDVPSEDPTQ